MPRRRAGTFLWVHWMNLRRIIWWFICKHGLLEISSPIASPKEETTDNLGWQFSDAWTHPFPLQDLFSWSHPLNFRNVPASPVTMTTKTKQNSPEHLQTLLDGNSTPVKNRISQSSTLKYQELKSPREFRTKVQISQLPVQCKLVFLKKAVTAKKRQNCGTERFERERPWEATAPDQVGGDEALSWGDEETAKPQGSRGL